MQVLRAEDHRRMKWKNGGGETAEIAVFPQGAGLDGFSWRISMADVASDGPFSLFPGIDRTLAVLSGSGIVLDVAGRGPQALTPEADPVSFSADVAAGARLIGGPIRDFNVMTRRGVFRHAVRPVAVAGETSLPVRGEPYFFLCAAGALQIACGGDCETLSPGDCLLLAAPSGCTLAVSGDGSGYGVELEKASLVD